METASSTWPSLIRDQTTSPFLPTRAKEHFNLIPPWLSEIQLCHLRSASPISMAIIFQTSRLRILVAIKHRFYSARARENSALQSPTPPGLVLPVYVSETSTETVFQTWPPQLPGRTPFPSSSAKATVPSNLLLPSRPVLGLWESQPPTSTAMGTSILSQRTMMSPPFPSRSATGEVDFRLTSTMSLDGI